MNNGMLRRYTNLPSLLCILMKKQLTLLDPSTWDDRNDSYYLELYTKRKKIGRTLALCLSEKNETYHHWSIFTSRENGVCIVFDRKKLEAHLDTHSGLMHGSVNYRLLSQMRKKKLLLEDLPFLKRHAFIDESEYRIIYPSRRDIGFKNIKLPLDTIKKVSVNPWAPDAFFEVIKKTIANINGCEKLTVGKSSLVNNKEWRSFGDDIVK